MTCLLRHLSAPTASVLLQPALAHAPPIYFRQRGGGAMLSLNTRSLKDLNHPVFLYTPCVLIDISSLALV